MVIALFEFGYDSERPRVERGEVFMPGGHPNDQTLLSLRYLSPATPGTQLYQCGECGKLFFDEYSRESHGDTWHSFVCECGWVSPPGTKAARADALHAHREKCDVMRDQRASQRSAHVQQVKQIKEATPVEVAG